MKNKLKLSFVGGGGVGGGGKVDVFLEIFSALHLTVSGMIQ